MAYWCWSGWFYWYYWGYGLINIYSMKQPDLHYFEAIKMMSKAESNFLWRIRVAAEYFLWTLTGLVTSFYGFKLVQIRLFDRISVLLLRSSFLFWIYGRKNLEIRFEVTWQWRTNQLRSLEVIVKLISIQPIWTEHLLFKVLMIDRATLHVVNSTWPDGLQVALKLWTCNFFSEDYRSSTDWPKIYLCSCKKIGLRKAMSYKASLNGVALLFRTCWLY